MTHPWVDLSVILSENRRVTHTGRPAGPVRSHRVRPVPVPVRKKPDRLQLCYMILGS
jgi:hypothetical protein